MSFVRSKMRSAWLVLALVFAFVVGGVFSTASPAAAYDGQAWYNCSGQYTYWYGGVYTNTGRYMGSMTVYGCSNGFWVRSASAIGNTFVTATLTRVTNPSYGTAGTGNYAAITPNLVGKKYGATYVAHAYIGGGVKDLKFTIYY
jgi:hypothetical protein